jgi:hypothetical protein
MFATQTYKENNTVFIKNLVMWILKLNLKMEFLDDKKVLNTNYRKWKWSKIEVKWYEKLYEVRMERLPVKRHLKKQKMKKDIRKTFATSKNIITYI